MSRVAELAAALALDRLLGEPPARLHPVVWTGRLLDLLEARVLATDQPATATASRGVVAVALAAAVVGVPVRLLARGPWAVRGVVLWTLLSARALLDEVAAVEDALVGDGLAAGRTRVARLVSPPPTALDEAEVRAAAVSTLAENVVDAVVATLLWWAVAGLPGAALHRLLDTADSRWGYPTPPWTERGRAAARADDLDAWLPARITALLWRGRLDRTLRDEAARTPSPNGGWPMGAAALALDVRLVKPGVHVLHPAGTAPGPGAVPQALHDARRVVALAAALALGAGAVRDALDRVEA